MPIDQPPETDRPVAGPRLSPSLSNHVGYLLGQAHLQAFALATLALEDDGLTPKHFGALTMISEGGPVSQSALVERSRIDRSTMVTVIDDLEAAGYVERRRNPADRRAYALEVTPAGAEWLRRAGRALRAAEGEMTHGLSVDEREQLVGLLQRLLAGSA